MTSQQTFDQLTAHARETALLESINGLLGWDERTKMPPAAGEYRAEQMTFMAGEIHRRQTDPQLGDWLSELAESELAGHPHSDAGATIRVMRRQFEKRRKVPRELVERLTPRVGAGATEVGRGRARTTTSRPLPPCWRKSMTFAGRRRTRSALKRFPTTPLLDDYEPGEKTSNVARVLAGLREDLVPLVSAIAESGITPHRELMKRRYPKAKQIAFGEMAAAKIGFDFQRGRLDETHHPFCGGARPARRANHHPL